MLGTFVQRSFRFALTAVLICFGGAVAPVLAQDSGDKTIVQPRPVPPAERRQAYDLEKIGLDVVIDGQKARCTLKYGLYNPGSAPLEVDFLAPLPEGGTVTGLTLMDGRTELVGQVYGKDEAWAVYRDIVAKMKDPALLEYAGRDTFRARVFPLPAKERRTLELTFDYLLPKNDGQVSLAFPLAGPLTLGRAPEQEVHLVLKDSPGLTNIYSPLAGVKIEHQPGQDAVVTYESRKTAVLDRFRLIFQTASSPLGGLILSQGPEGDEDGFFLFLAEPGLKPGAQATESAKDVVFVLDKSGSMSGPKFKQAQGALTFVLERLAPADRFGLVDYNDHVATWKPKLQDMTPENRRSALSYVQNLRSGGSTNIEEALQAGFKLVGEGDRPAYLVFLTDGLPTVGEEDEMKLAGLAKKANPGEAARLFSFGVGFDVNARLLDRLSGQAGGSSVFVNPDEDLEAKVSAFFSRLTSPALTRPALSADRPLNRVLPDRLPDLFMGQQMVVVGRYPAGGEAVFTLAGRLGGEDKKYEYRAALAAEPTPEGRFIASLWAQRRIGDLLDQIDLAGGTPNPELVAELVDLSKKYGILTPYTSFLALEDQKITRRGELAPLAASNLEALEQTVGSDANYQRAMKSEMKTADASPAPMMASSRQRASSTGSGVTRKAEETELDRQIDRKMQELAQFDKTVAQGRSGSLRPPREWGGLLFYFKEGRWQAANLGEEDLKNFKTIRQLSDEYYQLSKTLKPEELAWVSQAEPVLFRHGGEIYLIEPAE